MFGRVKKWLGMEGVKLKLKTLKIYPENVETINGEIEFSSMMTQRVTGIRMRLVERYSRGKEEEKRIDEYVLGEWAFDEPFEVTRGEPVSIFFKLPFQFRLSRMDKIGRKGFIRKGIVNFAKMLKGVESEYRLEAEAAVEELGWGANDKKLIQFGPLSS